MQLDFKNYSNCIYKLTLPDGRAYIGQAKNWHKRISTYLNRGTITPVMRVVSEEELFKMLATAEILEQNISDLDTAEMIHMKHTRESGVDLANSSLNLFHAKVDFWWCSVCREYLDKETFFHHSTRGRQNICRPCRKIYDKNRNDKNKEESKRYRVRNRDRISAVNKVWRQKNPEKVNGYYRKYRENNREKINERRRLSRARAKAEGVKCK